MSKTLLGLRQGPYEQVHCTPCTPTLHPAPYTLQPIKSCETSARWGHSPPHGWQSKGRSMIQGYLAHEKIPPPLRRTIGPCPTVGF
jgi:hypothetical protein